LTNRTTGTIRATDTISNAREAGADSIIIVSYCAAETLCKRLTCETWHLAGITRKLNLIAIVLGGTAKVASVICRQQIGIALAAVVASSV
jgi:hypothetical protein